MYEIVLVLITAACSALTLAFLGSLRSLAELRIRIMQGSEAGGQLRLDAGRVVPEPVLRAVTAPEQTALVAFLSENCSTCWELAEILPIVPLRSDQMVVCLLGDGQDAELRRRVATVATVLSDEDARAVASEWHVETTPLLALQRDGYVIGSAFGATAASREEVLQLVANAEAQAQEKFRQPRQDVAKRQETTKVGGVKTP